MIEDIYKPTGICKVGWGVWPLDGNLLRNVNITQGDGVEENKILKSLISEMANGMSIDRPPYFDGFNHND